MYSSARLSVNGRARRAALLGALGALALVGFARPDARARTQNDPPVLDCDSVLKALFTPARSQLGRYEVCTTREPLAALVRPEWRIETLPPLDAFGAAGAYDRAALSRLYGGRRATVARGWTEHGGRFESITLISPHPDATLTRLMPGTLVIRHVIIR
jgi:hypothetical protein